MPNLFLFFIVLFSKDVQSVINGLAFIGLVKLVEETIRLEHASSPNKPIYLVGDSFGGCLSLAVAARNPTIDLVLVLVNPGWCYGI